MDKQVFVPRSEDEASAELQRIFTQTMLFMAGSLGPAAGLHVVAAEEMEQGSVLEPDSLVSFAFVVDQQREVDLGLFAEEAGVARVAQADRREPRAFLLELLFEFAQLRDVLTAENSPVVTQEDQHRWAALPQ